MQNPNPNNIINTRWYSSKLTGKQLKDFTMKNGP